MPEKDKRPVYDSTEGHWEPKKNATAYRPASSNTVVRETPELEKLAFQRALEEQRQPRTGYYTPDWSPGVTMPVGEYKGYRVAPEEPYRDAEPVGELDYASVGRNQAGKVLQAPGPVAHGGGSAIQEDVKTAAREAIARLSAYRKSVRQERTFSTPEEIQSRSREGGEIDDPNWVETVRKAQQNAASSKGK